MKNKFVLCRVFLISIYFSIIPLIFLSMGHFFIINKSLLNINQSKVSFLKKLNFNNAFILKIKEFQQC